MTARDGVATDLAPLRFTDRVAMKSSALPAVELIPEWDKAIGETDVFVKHYPRPFVSYYQAL